MISKNLITVIQLLLILKFCAGFYKQDLHLETNGYQYIDESHSTKVETSEGFRPFDANSEFLTTKTGTTIVGLCCKEGVVLGADTRATGGPLVMDKNKHKIHFISSFISCCAAGTSADCDQVTRKASHDLALQQINHWHSGYTNKMDSMTYAIHGILNSLEGSRSSKGRGTPSSVMILGGIDDGGPALYTIDDSINPQRVSFAALGSGSIDAIAMLESSRRQWKRKNALESTNIDDNKLNTQIDESQRYIEDTDIETAINAVRNAVKAGILNDLGSGSHVDFCVIQSGSMGVRKWREEMQSTWEKYKHESGRDNNLPINSDDIDANRYLPSRFDTVSSESDSNRIGGTADVSKLGKVVYDHLQKLNPSTILVPDDCTFYAPELMIEIEQL